MSRGFIYTYIALAKYQYESIIISMYNHNNFAGKNNILVQIK